MQSALPFVDDFLPVHNLASLEGLAEHLNGLSPRRPGRRQQTWHLGQRAAAEPEPAGSAATLLADGRQPNIPPSALGQGRGAGAGVDRVGLLGSLSSRRVRPGVAASTYYS